MPFKVFYSVDLSSLNHFSSKTFNNKMAAQAYVRQLAREGYDAWM